MGIDRDLRDLAGREFVGALYFERGGSGLCLESTGQCRRNQCRGDFLMDLDDALAEQVFDQMEDGADVTPQEAADCVKAFKPKQVYAYHYSQMGLPAPDQNSKDFAAALKGTPGIEVKSANFYPPKPGA